MSLVLGQCKCGAQLLASGQIKAVNSNCQHNFEIVKSKPKPQPKPQLPNMVEAYHFDRVKAVIKKSQDYKNRFLEDQKGLRNSFEKAQKDIQSKINELKRKLDERQNELLKKLQQEWKIRNEFLLNQTQFLNKHYKYSNDTLENMRSQLLKVPPTDFDEREKFEKEREKKNIEMATKVVTSTPDIFKLNLLLKFESLKEEDVLLSYQNFGEIKYISEPQLKIPVHDFGKDGVVAHIPSQVDSKNGNTSSQNFNIVELKLCYNNRYTSVKFRKDQLNIQSLRSRALHVFNNDSKLQTLPIHIKQAFKNNMDEEKDREDEIKNWMVSQKDVQDIDVIISSLFSEYTDKNSEYCIAFEDIIDFQFPEFKILDVMKDEDSIRFKYKLSNVDPNVQQVGSDLKVHVRFQDASNNKIIYDNSDNGALDEKNQIRKNTKYCIIIKSPKLNNKTLIARMRLKYKNEESDWKYWTDINNNTKKLDMNEEQIDENMNNNNININNNIDNYSPNPSPHSIQKSKSLEKQAPKIQVSSNGHYKIKVQIFGQPYKRKLTLKQFKDMEWDQIKRAICDRCELKNVDLSTIDIKIQIDKDNTAPVTKKSDLGWIQDWQKQIVFCERKN